MPHFEDAKRAIAEIDAEEFISGLGDFHRYDEQLRVRKSDALIVDLRASLQEPFASAVAAEIEKRWNCYKGMLEALKMWAEYEQDRHTETRHSAFALTKQVLLKLEGK